MTDRRSGHHAPFLRTSGLRLDDLETEVVRFGAGESRRFDRPHRAFFLHALEGTIRVSRPEGAPHVLRAGDSVGIERAAGLTLGAPEDAVAIVSSVPRRLAYIANLPDDILPIPADDEAAPLLGSVAATLRVELESPRPDFEIVRRLCEVVMLGLLRKVRSSVVQMGRAPSAIQHDAHILRAWSAYFADPNASWTLEKLADVAGLSRSAFFDRFRAIFDAPPLETLTRLRLDHARQLLRDSSAPLARVAAEVGYQSETAFIRAFKRENGFSPGQWRRRDREGSGDREPR